MLSIVLAGLLFSPFADQSGTATYARLHGVVTTGYPNYKPVANAQVVASGDVDVRITRTDANGRYYFLTLLPGTYHVYVPSVVGMAVVGPRLTSLVLHANGATTTMYVAKDAAALRKCYEDANAPVELSAGLAYLGNFDLLTHCA